MKIKTLLYGLLVIVFIGAMFAANTVVALFTNAQVVQKVKLADYPQGAEVYFCVEKNEPVGGMLEKNYVQLWAFCETEQDNANKKIDLIFKSVSSDAAYAVSAPAQPRDDVYSAFADQLKIYGYLHEAEYNFATYAMKTGQYQLYIAVTENEADCGIVDTGMLFEKTASGLRQVEG